MPTIIRPGQYSVDEHTALAGKLAALELDDRERHALERLLTRASMSELAGIRLVAPAELLRPAVQRAIIRKVALTLCVPLARATDALRDALVYLDSATYGYAAVLAPSPEVDEAWHQLILFTEDYAKYCAAVAGRFIHHLPIIPGDAPPEGSLSVAESYAYLCARGHRLTEALWREPSSDDPSQFAEDPVDNVTASTVTTLNPVTPTITEELLP